jgi:hypothetical protein
VSDDFDLSKFVTRNGKRIAVGTVPSKAEPKKRRADLIGCPLVWFKRVIPILKTKEQLAIALWLYRRHSVCRRIGSPCRTNYCAWNLA